MKIHWTHWQNPGGYKEDNMKFKYEEPEMIVVDFMTEDVITASGDYAGIDFEDLI